MDHKAFVRSPLSSRLGSLDIVLVGFGELKIFCQDGNSSISRWIREKTSNERFFAKRTGVLSIYLPE